MDKFFFVSIMLFAIRRDMIDFSVIKVIDFIDRERGVLSRADFLELEFADAMYEHLHGISVGVYDKYFDNQQFKGRVLPF